MKALRLFLLVLLVMVLPMRGALAVTVHCGGDAGQMGIGAGEVQAQAAHAHTAYTNTAHVHATHTHDTHAHHDPAGPHVHGPVNLLDVADTQGAGADPADTCNFCAASCSVTPILSVMAPSAPSILLPRASLPALVAPPPSHLSEGQDRPPQSA